MRRVYASVIINAIKIIIVVIQTTSQDLNLDETRARALTRLPRWVPAEEEEEKEEGKKRV